MLHNKSRFTACAFLKGGAVEAAQGTLHTWLGEGAPAEWLGRETPDRVGLGEQMCTLDPCVSLGTLAQTTDGSWKKVKDTGELPKMVDTNAPWNEPSVRLYRKFWAKHLKLEQAE